MRDKEEVSGYGARKMAGSVTSYESHIISASKAFLVLLVKVPQAPDTYSTGRTGHREASAPEPEGLVKILRVFGQSLAMALKFSSTLHSLLRAANSWVTPQTKLTTVAPILAPTSSSGTIIFHIFLILPHI